MLKSAGDEIIGSSAHSAAIRQFIRRAARSACPVVLLGEQGVGKEFVARRIHKRSTRGEHPFLMIDCSLYYERELRREIFGYRGTGSVAKSRKGLLEFASRGTCYLARIEELSPGLQECLLEFLRAGTFRRLGDGREISSHVRLIASSDKNLVGFVNGGLFNEELYRELSRESITLAPLRERVSDIEALALALAESFAAERALVEVPRFTPEALEALKCFPWPRNCDQLEKELLQVLEAGASPVGTESLSFEVSAYWMGQRGDPEVRKVMEEIDGYIREFKVLSRLEAEFGDVLLNPGGWACGSSAGGRGLGGAL